MHARSLARGVGPTSARDARESGGLPRPAWAKAVCLLLVFTGLGRVPCGFAQRRAWPAEPEEQATNLSAASKGLRKDLSGAVWNPVTRTLWVCRNGPGADGRLWALEERDRGLCVEMQGERRREWRGLGDSEGVALADFAEDVVYLIIEGEERIHALDVSIPGETRRQRVFDTRPFLPLDGSDGAEGITFVPDEHLARAAFVDSRGLPRVSRQGMGGLMFVGHQNGGGVYAFDLNRQSGAVDFVGEYRVVIEGGAGGSALSKVVGLEFDRSTSRLFVWHGLRGGNALSELELSSEPVPGETFRRFRNARVYRGPSDRSYEGLALVPTGDCGPRGRALYLTVDDGGAHSLLRYACFTLGCAGSSAVPAEEQSRGARQR